VTSDRSTRQKQSINKVRACSMLRSFLDLPSLCQRSHLTRPFASMANKRTRSGPAATSSSSKKQRVLSDFLKSDDKPSSDTKDEPTGSGDVDESAYIQQVHGKIATAENAARVDANPPLAQLQNAIAQHKMDIKNPRKGDCVVYWMRMEDMRGQPPIQRSYPHPLSSDF
jgi:hypothetical protein